MKMISPNGITVGRLISVAFLFAIMFILSFFPEQSSWNKFFSFVATIVFVVSMLSDILDGYLARKYSLISAFGTFIDPLADKLLFLVAMVMLIPLHRISAPIVILFMAREIMVTALRSVAAERGIIITASHWGKYKSAFVSTATACLIFHHPFFGAHWRTVGVVLLIPALFFSLASGVHYTVTFFKAIKI